MKIIALLPLKGHSERVPNKNIRIFDDKPLFQIILNKLLKISIIDEIIINTDSKEIIDIVFNKDERIKIHPRPDKLIGDFVPMNSIIQYDLENSEGDIFLQTHSTNPLLTVETLLSALKLFTDFTEKYDSMFSITKHQARFYNEKFEAINHKPTELLRTQDLPALFEENSSFYIFSKESFSKNKYNRIGLNPYLYQMNKIESIDIDEEADFILAELIYKNFPKYR